MHVLATRPRGVTTLFFNLCAGFLCLGAGCGAKSEPAPMSSTVSRVCKKVDECNFLERGFSAADCEDGTQRCLDDQLKSARADWEMVLQDCLQFSNCENFEKCARKLDYCGFGEPSQPTAGSKPPPGQDAGPVEAKLRAGLIQFSTMYSAFDGERDYQLTPSVPSAASSSTDPDAVDESTLVWDVDSTFVSKENFADLPGAILLTTKKAGQTLVKVSATTRGGDKVRGEARLVISQADPAEWTLGDARYSNGMMINIAGGGAQGTGTCGLPFDLKSRLPTNSACSNCHGNTGGIALEYTPTQTAGYSDDELIEIFSNARKPAGGKFNSDILKNTPMPDCVYKTFHTWQIDDDTKLGIVWKLRSIAPKKQADVDVTRLSGGSAGH